MEFYEKLQQLRKQKGLTQEELANALYVSRTAVSKWESGRGYPNIDSLKEIAKFFNVRIDDLLSGGEALTIAAEDHRQKESHTRDLVFGLLDISTSILLFAPLFGQRSGDCVQAVSLLPMTELASYLKVIYLALIMAMVSVGILTLAMQKYMGAFWLRSKGKISLLLNGCAAFLFVISLQPYAAVLVMAFWVIKVVLLLKKP